MPHNTNSGKCGVSLFAGEGGRQDNETKMVDDVIMLDITKVLNNTVV